MSEPYQPISEFEATSGIPSNEFDENQNIPSAQTWTELAEKWASEDEDIIVKNDKFSALHYYKKSEEILEQVTQIKQDVINMLSENES